MKGFFWWFEIDPPLLSLTLSLSSVPDRAHCTTPHSLFHIHQHLDSSVFASVQQEEGVTHFSLP